MSKQGKRKYIGRIHDSADAWIDTIIDLIPEQPELCGIYWNKAEPVGLRLYVGKQAVTWAFLNQRREHGDRTHTYVPLGKYDRGSTLTTIGGGKPMPAGKSHSPTEGRPAVYRGPEPILHRAPWHMSFEAACEAATIERAKLIQGKPTVNPQAGPTFAQAFDGGYEITERGRPVKIEGYLQYLERKAKKKNKPARWAERVRSLGKLYLLPKFGTWRLNDMAESQNRVADELEKIKSAVSANHCSRIVNAMYRRTAKRDKSLEITKSPSRVYEAQEERGHRPVMIPSDFPAWYQKVMALPSPVHQAYHLCNLLTGTRPGELARTTWEGNSPDGLLLDLGSIKSRLYSVHTTPEIRACLKIAADAFPKRKPTDLIFPGCWNNPTRDDIPMRGHALRRTYRSFAHSQKISDDIGDWLLGDAPEGIKPSYLPKWAMDHNDAIIEAQHQISKAMMAALKAKPKGKPAAKRKRAA